MYSVFIFEDPIDCLKHVTKKEMNEILTMNFIAKDWLHNDILFVRHMLYFSSIFKTVRIYILCCFFIKPFIEWSFQNYRQRYAYIITEMPQVHTIIDFCRLLQQEECRTIVMLNSGFTDTQVQFRMCYSVLISSPKQCSLQTDTTNELQMNYVKI